MVYLTSYINPVEKIRVSSSAWAVLTLLDQKRVPLAVHEIQNELPYAERTIYFALRQLQDKALIEKHINLKDLREAHYRLATRAGLFGFFGRR
ncbi:MAG: hypothetical protein JSW11_16880 [Candidatus Heimdallarchaeota archaeon]|nr:MAG: hypothetical protein JSW11_16880 [Candidatus Heimdallarchaeota archaeon]